MSITLTQPTLTPRRKPYRLQEGKEAAYAVLDEALVCHVGTVVDGHPRVLPTLHVRLGDTVYLHGSSGMTAALNARGGAEIAASVTVTLIDGLVFAPSHFDHSVNYRSVMAYGQLRLVDDPVEKQAALDAMVDHVADGRATDSRGPTDKELAQTAVLAMPLDHFSTKVRSGPSLGPDEERPGDVDNEPWVGVVPLELRAGTPVPDPGWDAPLPAYLIDYHRRTPERGPWYDAAPLTGALVRLEPLDLEHVDDLYAATDDPEVWQHLSARQPRSRADMARHVAASLQNPDRRIAWAQIDAGTGRAIGSTSFYDIDPTNRSVAIGYTYLGRDAWRTGINTESKLLLLRHAFETLGARRVVWHTDIRNTRSQDAIARLGATKEAVLRAHKVRADGTQRDTVQFAMVAEDWPAARDHLTERLRAYADR